jgi:hypothetical protein
VTITIEREGKVITKRVVRLLNRVVNKLNTPSEKTKHPYLENDEGINTITNNTKIEKGDQDFLNKKYSKKEFLGEDFPDFDEPEEIPDSQKGLSSPEGTNRVWIDTRDGKGRIILNETSNVVNSGDTQLSVFSIIRWVDETTLTVTGVSGDEAADYIVDIETGEYRKITNTFSQNFGRRF